MNLIELDRALHQLRLGGMAAVLKPDRTKPRWKRWLPST